MCVYIYICIYTCMDTHINISLSIYIYISGHSSMSSLWCGREQDYAARLEAKYVATLEEKVPPMRIRSNTPNLPTNIVPAKMC